jgi:LEA14-like dessication related protein
MKPLHAIALTVLALLPGLGCATVKQPTASFKTMNVTGITPQGFTMAFDLDVRNPNPVALPLSDTDYKLQLGGVNVLEGKAKPEGTLPANGTLPITLPVTVTFENLLAAEKAISQGGGKIPYAFSGNIDLAGAAGASSLLGKSASVPLEYKGTLDLKSLLSDPQVLLQSPAAKKLAQQLMSGWFGK